MLTGGMTQAESPEWMPASSMCSMTAGTKASVAVGERVGLALDGVLQEPVDQDRAAPGVTSTAAATYSRSISSSWTTSMPRPPST